MNTDGGIVSTDIKDSVAEDDAAQAILSPDEIRERGSKVDPKAVASETLGWLTRNVENFIENRETQFRLYLVVDKPDEMPAASELQALYLAIPPVLPREEDGGASEELEAELIEFLNGITQSAGDAMTEDSEGLGKLFKRMAFFYEMTGYSKEVGPIVQEMAGVVKVNDFFFDTTPLEITVTRRDAKMVDGQVEETRTVDRVEKSPAAFGVELEIEIWPKGQETSMY